MLQVSYSFWLWKSWFEYGTPETANSACWIGLIRSQRLKSGNMGPGTVGLEIQFRLKDSRWKGRGRGFLAQKSGQSFIGVSCVASLPWGCSDSHSIRARWAFRAHLKVELVEVLLLSLLIWWIWFRVAFQGCWLELAPHSLLNQGLSFLVVSQRLPWVPCHVGLFSLLQELES